MEGVYVLDKKSPVRVLLADHHGLFRQGLRTLIATERDCVVVGEAQDYQELMASAHALGEAAPNVIVVVRDLPGVGGEADWDRIRATFGAQLLVLTTDSAEAAHAEHGCHLPSIHRREAAGLLLPLIRQLARQSATTSLQNLAITVDRFRSNTFAPQPAPSGPALTPRENEILLLLATGNTVKDAANELDLSVKTVEAHKFNLMRKLNIHSRAELVEHARRCGILEPAGVPVPVPVEVLS